jgi:ribonucleoside-diphosphate reductase alpha chain
MRRLSIKRTFTTPGVDPADEITWEKRSASITGEGGEVVFEQKDVEVPKPWSALATNVVASRYFRGPHGSPKREGSVRKMVERVVDTITCWGKEGGYFATDADADTFKADLTFLILHQSMSFNSPVWFNVGIEEHPQCSACFINSVEDSMDSILGLAHTEGMLFKYGSGTGTNFSSLRSSRENLAGGGTASGPVSFMRGFDAFAGVIKSGGKTRRAAKMVILNADHPDILDFIRCKSTEEKKAWALIDAGYDGSFNGEAYRSVFFQNSNNSVRVTDAFMRSVEKDDLWTTRSVRDGRPMDTLRSRELFREIAENTHMTGDPGMQFHDTINASHTCAATDEIRASNPCSEFMFLDDSACNLASLNLMHFRIPGGEFDPESFSRAVELTILAQEILVDGSRYPTEKISQNSRMYRPLGLGYANLGALLMARGLPYDSEAGRAYAAAITSLMTGVAYRMSARISEGQGPFGGFDRNRDSMLKVIRRHRDYSHTLDGVPSVLIDASRSAWEEALSLGLAYGFRNAQTTVLAPTGTIGFMMDCDTTGIEPDIALVKYKKLVGGGLLKIVNGTVAQSLERLGYPQDQIQAIVEHLEQRDTIEGAPLLKPEDLPVFDCAFRAMNGSRSIHWLGHVKMMAAVQPFLSGAISKTVNLPHEATVEEIEQVYLMAWKSGLKAIAVYRDGCKRTQPVSAARGEPSKETIPAPVARKKLPDERRSITHKFSVGGHEGYLTVGMYDDGKPGELFCVMAKEGSVVSGLMDCFATSISLALQYGVPLQVLVDKFIHTRFEPSGFTNNKDIPIAKSVADYIFRWLEIKFLGPEETSIERATFLNQADAPPCPTCGSIMVRSGTCYKCSNCGATNGCS